MSQIDTEKDKNLKDFQFSKILCIFSKFPTNFVDWNVKEAQQGTNVLSSMLRIEINSVFQTITVRN